MSTDQFGVPLYTPPRLRVSAKYATADARSPQSVDVELNDENVPITSAFVGDLIARMLATGAVQVTTTTTPPPPVRTADEIYAAGGTVSYPLTATTTATAPTTITYFGGSAPSSNSNGGNQ